MTPSAHHVTHSTTVLLYISEMILNLLIAATTIAIGVLLFTY